MNRKLLHLVFAAALSGTAALGVASDSDFITDEIRGLHSELADTRRWVDSDIRANLAHRWETIPNRLAQRGFGWAESELESLSWIPNADLAVESDSTGRLAGFSAGGTGLLWTGESAAVGFQPWGRWTDGGENDAASFGVFSRRALGDWVVVGGNIFADYAASAEFGDFARWSAGLDFQSALGELRGNYYAGLSSTRERVGLENRVLAYAPSGVDAELRLRWFGGSEWSGFAEYEKWSGQFGDSDLEEVGYGLTFRPAGGGLLAGLQVDAGFRDSADSAGRWDLRLGYSRRLGADDSVRDSGSAFGVRSALVASVAREREIRINTRDLPLEFLPKYLARTNSIPTNGFLYFDDPELHSKATFYPMIIGQRQMYSTDKGVVWQVEVPKFPGASIALQQQGGRGYLTVDADNQISVISGVRLVDTGGMHLRGKLTPVNSTVEYNVWIVVDIHHVEAPIGFTSSKIPKVAPDYTGPVFTVSIIPGPNFAAFAFETTGTAAYYEGTYGGVGLVPDWIFQTDFAGFPFQSANGDFMGNYWNDWMVVSLPRRLRGGNRLVGDLFGFARFQDYADARLSMAFTIAGVAQPRPISVGLAMGQTGDIYTLSADVEGLTFSQFGLSEKLDVSPKGVVRVNPAIKLEEGLHTITVRATSPNLLGELEFVVYAFVECKSQREGGGLLTDGPRVDSPNNTKLYNNVSGGNVQAVCEALRAGANPNYAYLPNPNNGHIKFSVLGKIVGNSNQHAPIRNIEIVTRLLLEAGADPNARAHGISYDYRGGAKHYTTALHLAAKKTSRYAGYVRLLLAYGADANRLNFGQEKPVYLAAALSGGDDVIFNLLLDATSNLNHKTNIVTCGDRVNNPCKRDTILHEVAENGTVYRFAKVLLAGASANITNHQGRNSCHEYYQVDCTLARKLRYILDTGEAVNADFQFGLAPLHYAVLEKNIEFVRDLLAIPGVNPKVETTKVNNTPYLPIGSTPLDFARVVPGLPAGLLELLEEAVEACGQNSHYAC